MMDDGSLRELYQEVILEHSRHPRNYGRPEQVDRVGRGHNPLCGDAITVYLHLDGDRIAQVGIEGAGCAISTASASLMTEAVRGKTLDEVQRLFDAFHEMVTTGQGDPDALGKLAVLAGVRAYPIRVKCATLAWHTLRAAIEDRHDTVVTE